MCSHSDSIIKRQLFRSSLLPHSGQLLQSYQVFQCIFTSGFIVVFLISLKGNKRKICKQLHVYKWVYLFSFNEKGNRSQACIQLHVYMWVHCFSFTWLERLKKGKCVNRCMFTSGYIFFLSFNQLER